jgi:hypothetical protein
LILARVFGALAAWEAREMAASMARARIFFIFLSGKLREIGDRPADAAG